MPWRLQIRGDGGGEAIPLSGHNSYTARAKAENGDSTDQWVEVEVVDGRPVGGTLHPLSLFAVVYMMVCGGAYGTEALGSSIPPLQSLIGLIAVPVFWSLPMAMITAELGTALPLSGFWGWIKAAWGEGVAFVDGFIFFTTNVTDLALYPLVFVLYIDNLVVLGPVPKYLICLAFLLISAFIACSGLQTMSTLAKGLAVITTVPFIIYVIYGLQSSSFSPRVWLETTMPGPPNYAYYMGVLIWCTTGYEYSGFLAKDVRNPNRTFPTIILLAVVAMGLTYVIPVAVTLAAAPSRDMIVEGAYPKIARTFGAGYWLEVTFAVGGMLCVFAIYNAYLFTTSTGLRAMSEDGKAPKIFSWFPNRRSPIVAVIFFTLTSSVLVLGEFPAIVQIESILTSWHLVLLAITLPRLRVTAPSLARPFRMKGGMVTAMLAPVGPLGVAFFIIYFSPLWHTLVALGIALFAVLLYGAVQLYEQRKVHGYSSVADARSQRW